LCRAITAGEALLADDIEWDLMPTGQKLKGKPEVMPWLTAGAASRKEPVTISNLAAGNWGIFEYGISASLPRSWWHLAARRSGRGRKIQIL